MPKRPPRGPTTEMAHVPAPIGGLNTVDSGSNFPPADGLLIYNMLAAEYGLRTRLGYKEWCTGMPGSGNNEIRTIIPFTGSASNGSADKLFCTCNGGIYDISASSALPTLVLAWSYMGSRAGYGSFVNFTTPGGHFLMYCDEENGLFVYSQTSGTWRQAEVGVTQIWEGATLYVAGNSVINDGNEYVCVTGGTSAASGGPTGTTAGIADGSVVWDWVQAQTAETHGPSLADQQAGFTFDTLNFVACVAWKSRVWLVERDSSRAWYLDTNAVYGTCTSFDFGSKMRAGGPLVNLFNYTYDGGAGLDDSLVGISQAGDVVIYQGTDPSSATTFGLKGVWSVGAVPAGRRIATEHGGDLLILSLLGVVPLSKLVVGNDETNALIYSTAKIANLFGRLMAERRNFWGWAMHIHPSDNCLVVIVPANNPANVEQLVMSFGTKGWSRYRDFPAMSGGIWEGDFYFGTSDGRVCRNEGYLDNVSRDGTTWDDIPWSVLTAYRNLGSMRQKQVKILRPILINSSGSPPVQAHARYDYNLEEPAAPSGSSTTGWDYGVWDTEVWGGEQTTYAPIGGAVGMGRDVAIAVRGTASSRTILVGVDVLFEQGGPL